MEQIVLIIVGIVCFISILIIGYVVINIERDVRKKINRINNLKKEEYKNESL